MHAVEANLWLTGQVTHTTDDVAAQVTQGALHAQLGRAAVEPVEPNPGSQAVVHDEMPTVPESAVPKENPGLH